MDIIIEITKLYLSFNSIGKIIKNANEGTLKSIVPYDKSITFLNGLWGRSRGPCLKICCFGCQIPVGRGCREREG